MNNNSKFKQTIMEVSEEIGYVGQKKSIRLMSSYEFKAVRLLKQLFLLKRIKSWNSEEVIIPYLSMKDNKTHRYFMDFCITTKEDKIILIEVKPDSQTRPPKLKRNCTEKQKRSYEKAMQDYITNYDKWSATIKYVEEMNQREHKFAFQIWTEKTLNL